MGSLSALLVTTGEGVVVRREDWFDWDFFYLAESYSLWAEIFTLEVRTKV
jgi:hypothetical protein